MAMIDKVEMSQRGCIVFGPEMNGRAWLDEAKKEGYSVLVKDGFAELWSPKTRAEIESGKKK